MIMMNLLLWKGKGAMKDENNTCQSCGAIVPFDIRKQDGDCEHCGRYIPMQNRDRSTGSTSAVTDESLVEYGYKLQEMGSFEEADSKFKKALDINSENWKAWKGLADSILNRKPYKDETVIDFCKKEHTENEWVEFNTDYISDYRKNIDRAIQYAPTAKKAKLEAMKEQYADKPEKMVESSIKEKERKKNKFEAIFWLTTLFFIFMLVVNIYTIGSGVLMAISIIGIIPAVVRILWVILVS